MKHLWSEVEQLQGGNSKDHPIHGYFPNQFAWYLNGNQCIQYCLGESHLSAPGGWPAGAINAVLGKGSSAVAQEITQPFPAVLSRTLSIIEELWEACRLVVLLQLGLKGCTY